jgi:hypothetical protein
VNVDGAVVSLALEVDIEGVLILGIGQDLCTVERHDVIGNGFDTLETEVHIIDAKITLFFCKP